MANGEVVVAVDVSMAQLDVAQWPSGESFSVDNEAAEWRSCWPGARSGSRRQSWSRPAGGRKICWSRSCARRRLRWRWLIRVRCASLRSLGKLAKTDRLDALVLAQFGHSAHSHGRLNLTQLRPEAEVELKALVRRRRRASKVVKRSIVASIRGLKRALAELEQQV